MTATLPAKISEADFLGQVIELAKLLGWHAAHFRPAQTARGWRTPVQGDLGAGWPDLVLVRESDKRLLFIELKAEKGKLSDAQRVVGDILERLANDETAGAWETSVAFHVWKPSDFDEIAATLR